LNGENVKIEKIEKIMKKRKKNMFVKLFRNLAKNQSSTQLTQVKLAQQF